MSIKFGDKNDILAINFGTTRIAQVYYGSELVYQNYFVKITFYFDDTDKAKNARGKLGNRAKVVGAEWCSTADPHVWYVITPLYTKGAGANDPSLGIGKLFCGEGGDPGLLLQSAVGTCQVTDISGDYDKIETLDRVFQRCTAITSISKTGFYDKFLNSTKLTNVNSVCYECTSITDGSSLNGYNVFNTISSITTHASTFTSADSTSNLDQIPTSWGGNMAPPATQWNITKITSAGWSADTTVTSSPDFTTVTALEVFTTSSVSIYAGVNMRKNTIGNKSNGFSNANTATTFYYPAFFQGTGTWPSTTAGQSFTATWIFAPSGYNGTLAAGVTGGDMPGTLDHELYGQFETRYNTFNSASSTYFGFLVLNSSADIFTFDAATTKYGILTNSNFRDTTLNWYEPTP